MNHRPPIKMIPITDLLCEIIDNRGQTCPTTDKGFPLIATNCIKHSSIYPTFENVRYVTDETLQHWFRAQLQPNDILFVNKGTPGRVCLVPNPVTFCAAQDMIGLRANPAKINYKYLFAVLRSSYIQKKIENFHVGIVIPHFKKTDLYNLLIPIVDETSQNAIGDLYINLSEKIELNNKINEELEQMAKLLFDYWFVQFDFPDENGKPYKSSGGKMTYNPQLKREIPDGWEVTKLQENLTLLKDGTHNPPKRQKTGIPLLMGNMFGNSFLSFSNATFISENDYNFIHSKYQPKPNDIIMTKIGTIGKINLLTENDVPLAIHCNSALLRTNELFHNYLFYFLKSTYFYSFLKQYAAKTIQEYINLEQLGNILIIVPPNNIVKQFSNIVLPIITKQKNIHLENQQLAELRDWLLPMLMNGQVKIEG